MYQEERTQKPLLRAMNITATFVGLAAFAFILSSFAREGVPQPGSGRVSEADRPSSPVPQPMRGRVLGENDTERPGLLKSENFKLSEVSVGGEIGDSGGEDDPGVLEISAVRGESFLEKNNKDVKVLITWKTTKLAQSTVTYGKNSGGSAKTFEEDGYGMDHSVILSGLDPASTYTYSVAARDRSGNEVVSETYAVYTSAKSASLFDLISGAFSDVFSWAVKK
jgi:hypothetical protein